jgi:hypothetical protein
MSKSGFRLCLLLLLVLACEVPTFAQVPTGTPPMSSLSGGPDIINLANLNSHITIPILGKSGRGLPFTFNLTHDSSVWYPVTSSGSTSWQPVPNWGWSGSEAKIGYIISTESETARIIPCGKLESLITTTVYGWTYQDGFATPHPFGATTVTVNQCTNTTTPTSLGATAVDGSGYTFSATGSTVNSLVGPDGNIINAPVNVNTGAGSLQDRNGNQISVSSSGVLTDTLGQTALTVAGSGTPTSPFTYTYPAPSGANAVYTEKYTSQTIKTNFGCSGITEYTASSVPLVSEIDLPDTTKYLFTYEPTPGSPGDVTGRLASVTLPTGGEITYTYSGGSNGIVCADGSTATLTRTTPDTGANSWTYAHSETGTAWTTTITDPQSNKTVLNFQGNYPTERQVYQGASTLLKTVTTCYNGNTSSCNSTAITLPITQRTVFRQWPGGLESRSDSFYNSHGLVTEKDEYAYGSGAPGGLTRKTLITYASLTNGIYNRPATVTVQDGSGNTKSQTTYTFDQGSVTTTSSTPQHVAVSGSRGNATTISYLAQGSTSLSRTYTYYDTGNVNTATDVNGAVTTYAYGSGTSCGNSFATSVSEPLSLSRSMAWNCTGGVQTSVTDENGQPTTTTSNDAFFWRPNKVTDAASNVANFTYDAQTSVEGAVVFGSSTTDALTTFDELGRAHISQLKESPSSSTYDSVETDFDSLGRPARVTLPYAAAASTTNSSAPSNQTTYDALGRKTQVKDNNNRTVSYTYTQNDTYRTLGPAPTGENTKRKQSEYDALGRLTSVCEVTSATGSGTCAQTSTATGYWTEYSYDALNHLTGVIQNAQSSGSQQTRTYAYDDLAWIIHDFAGGKRKGALKDG